MAPENNHQMNAGVALIRGPYKDVVEQSLLALASAEETLVIDAADIFNNFTLEKYGRRLSISDIEVFSPITAFQLKQFVESELDGVMASAGVKTIVVFGMKPVFFDPNLLSFEYMDLFKSVMDKLRAVASEHESQVVILTFNESYECDRDEELSEALDSEVDVVFNLNELKVRAVN